MRNTLAISLFLALALTGCLGAVQFSYQCRKQTNNLFFEFTYEDDSGGVPADIWIIGYAATCNIALWTGSGLSSNYPWGFNLVYSDVTSLWSANCEPTQIGPNEFEVEFMVKYSPLGLYSPMDNIYYASCDFDSLFAVVNTQDVSVVNPTVPTIDASEDEPRLELSLMYANGDDVTISDPPFNGDNVWLQACRPADETFTGFHMQNCVLSVTGGNDYLFMDSDGCTPSPSIGTYSYIPSFTYDSDTSCASTFFKWPAPIAPGLVLVISCDGEVCHDCTPSAGDSHCTGPTRRKREATLLHSNLGTSDNKEMVDVNKLYVAVLPNTQLEELRRASEGALSLSSVDNVSQCMSLTAIITSLCILGVFLFIALSLAVFLYCRGRRSLSESNRTLVKVAHTNQSI